MPMDTYEEIEIIKHIKGQSHTMQDSVVTELPFAIWLNGSLLATIICTPIHLKELAVGFLFSERIVTTMDDLLSIEIDKAHGRARVDVVEPRNTFNEEETPRFITPGCLFGTASITGREKIDSDFQIESSRILALVKKVSDMSHIYRTTGGVHSAALCSPDNVVVFREDIGRHNAIDKVIGFCLLEGINPQNYLLITSGRISSAVTGKVINAHIPIMASSSAPTLEAVKLAEAFGITVIGFARGRRMNVYTGGNRITDLS